MRIEVFGASLELSPNGAAYWAEFDALLVADLHLGKGSSFRVLGQSPVPPGSTAASLEKLSGDLIRYQPQRLWILGDLWHRAEGCTDEVVESFAALIHEWNVQEVVLIEGNHDRRTSKFDDRIGLIRRETDEIAGVTLCHEPSDAHQPFFAGHLHPGVVLYGKGGQAVKRPCFHQTTVGMVFPAYGDFTGTVAGDVAPEDRLFVLGGEQVYGLTGADILQSYPRPFGKRRQGSKIS